MRSLASLSFGRLVGSLVVAASLGSIGACSSGQPNAGGSVETPAPTDASVTPEASADGSTADGGQHLVPPPLPVIPNQGGPVLANPELVTITWAGDPIAPGLEGFDQWLATSATWKTMMAEWGVGQAAYAGATRVATPAPGTLDEAAISSLLLGGFADGTIPPPNGSRIYMIYPPSGTIVTEAGGYEGCKAFQAYHSAIDVPASGAQPAVKAYYAATPRCADTSGFSALDYVTWGSSHEAMEAASDPQYDHPAWRIDTQSLATPELGENADLCAGQPTNIDGHEITRNWSNVAAKAGERPCVPAPAGPMFGMFADPGEVTITPGQTLTVILHAYAASPYPAFGVGVYPLDPTLTATVDRKSASDGDVVTLTLTASTAFVETPGQNLVFLYGQGKDYLTKRHLIVHGA